MTKCKKTSVKLIICLLALLALAAVLVGCNPLEGPADYDHLVTFNYNLGNLQGNAPNQHLGVFDGSLVIIRPGYSNKFDLGIVSGHYVDDWYLPELDANGNVQTDENGFVKLGSKWNFKTQRVYEDVTLYAKLKRKTQIRFINTESGTQVEGDKGKMEFVPGEYAFKPSSGSAPSMAGYTFLGKYYTTREANEEFDWGNGVLIGEQDIDVYVSFLEGEWEFVSTAEGFKTAVLSNRNIYLEADINFADFIYETQFWSLGEYNGEIAGNGYTLSNINRPKLVASKGDSDSGKNYFAALFGVLGENAYIHDVTFENVNVEFEVNSSYGRVEAYVGLLAGIAKEGARFNNVTISGKLEYSLYSGKDISANLIGNHTENDIGIVSTAEIKQKEA